MIRGEVFQLSYSLTLPSGADFTLTSPAVTVYDPTFASTSPTVTANPGTSAPTQVLSADYTVPLAGGYQARWVLPSSDGQTLRPVQVYFAAITNPYDTITTLLQTDPGNVTPSIMDLHLAIIVRKLINEYNTVLPSYEFLNTATPDDQLHFDTAIGYLAAARIRPFMEKSVSIGEILSFEGSQDKFTYANPSRPVDPLEDQWLRFASDLLYQVSFLNPSYKHWQTDFKTIRFAGKRRALESRGYYSNMVQTLRTILLDDMFYQNMLGPIVEGF